ncbi:Aminopeptidase S [Aquisphaera giovannonii]|uniref:Aminopeptidase S n=1 Tax=Aquisphaera giovannonii TaxID=406548 RepID=A0A5B9VXB1_9BACT|nr:M20/M25/M40 family metallo-hydrolase [Aquisphaera giovannonii]QEH32501.1 Aminopeptidase S [Aquisphaera giovannonii]
MIRLRGVSWCALGAAFLVSSPPAALAQEPGPAAKESEPPAAIRSITGKEIGGHLRFLASDLMRGRDTASPESRLAGQYLASHLFAAGAEPMGEPEDGKPSYFQTIPLESVTPLEQGTELVLTLERNGSKQVIPCKLGGDFFLYPRGLVAGEIEAPVVFAGYGRSRSDPGADDYEGLDVRGKIALVYDGQPGEGPKSDGHAPAFNPFAKGQAARKNGAVAVLLIRPPGREWPAAARTLDARGMGFDRPSMRLASSPSEIPVIGLTDPVRDVLVAGLGLTADSKPRAPDGLGARFGFAARREVKTDRNVVGLFPGSDPEKKKEVVVFSAHYDHVGVDEKGEIFNGSDDNASGTSSLLEIAEAFGQAPRPSRSVAFLWVSGEEKGLLGSQWFAGHMTLPEGYKVVADINLDMVSRNDPHRIGVTPSPRHDEYNALVPAAQRLCKAEGLELVFDADEYFHRTDSASFAHKGVPVIFFFAGVHEDYHRPTDDVEKADVEKAARVARAAFRLGWSVATAEKAPTKIKPEEKAAAR